MEADGTCFEMYTADSVRPHGHINVVDAAMKESVSFGRFSMDDFSWARRSSFNHNQYLEEVGSCSTPGSVAQKKAYFESYYARKKALERALAEEASSVVVQGEKFKKMGNDDDDDDDDGDDNDETPLVKGYEYRSVPQSMESTSMMNLIPSLPMKSIKQGFLHTHGHPFPIDSIKKNHTEAMEEPKKSISVVGNNKVANIPLDLREDKNDDDDSDNDVDESFNGIVEQSLAYVADNEPPNMVGVPSDKGKFPNTKKLEILDKFEAPILQQDQDPEENLNSTINSNDSANLPKIKSGILQKASHSTTRVLKILLPTRNTITKLGSKSSVKDPTKEPMKESGKGKRFIEHRNDSKSLNLPESSHRLQSVGNPRTNFTVPQPFALATDSRASSSVGSNVVDIEVIRAKKRPDHTANLAQSRKNHIKDFHMGEVLAKTEQRSSNSKILQGETSKKSRKNEAEDNQVEGSPLEARSTPNLPIRKGKPYQVQSNARSNFSLSSNVRAEKRKEFNLKLEAKLIAKETEKNQVQDKTKEEIAAEIKELRKSLNFKAAPMPGFYQQEAPSSKKDINKIPPTQPKSPKLGRKGSESMATDPHSGMESVQKFEGLVLGRVKGPLKGVSEGCKFEHYIEASWEEKGHWNGGLTLEKASDSSMEGIVSMRSRGIVHPRPHPPLSVNIETINREAIPTRNVSNVKERSASNIKERNASNIKERSVSNFKERNVCNGKERSVSNFKEGNVFNVKERKFSDEVEERNVSNIREKIVSNLKERNVSDSKERNASNIRDRSAFNRKERNTSDIKERNVSDIRDRSVSNLKERNASNLKERNASNLKERNASNLKEGNVSNLKERCASNLKERNVSNIKERSVSNLKEGNVSNVKEGNVSNVKERNASNIKERSISNIKERNLSNLKERSISNTRERNVSNFKEVNVSNGKERNPKTSKKEVAKVVAARPASLRRGTVCGSDKRNHAGGGGAPSLVLSTS